MPKALSEFAQERRGQKDNTQCPVCRLPAAVRAQIRATNRKVVNFGVVLAWLKSEYGVQLTRADLQSHARARHDAQDA